VSVSIEIREVFIWVFLFKVVCCRSIETRPGGQAIPHFWGGCEYQRSARKGRLRRLQFVQ
jgi:hypothetical protein